MARPEGGRLETSAGISEGAPPNHLEVLLERLVHVGMVAKKEDLKGQRSQLYHVSDERGRDRLSVSCVPHCDGRKEHTRQLST